MEPTKAFAPPADHHGAFVQPETDESKQIEIPMLWIGRRDVPNLKERGTRCEWPFQLTKQLSDKQTSKGEAAEIVRRQPCTLSSRCEGHSIAVAPGSIKGHCSITTDDGNRQITLTFSHNLSGKVVGCLECFFAREYRRRLRECLRPVLERNTLHALIRSKMRRERFEESRIGRAILLLGYGGKIEDQRSVRGLPETRNAVTPFRSRPAPRVETLSGRTPARIRAHRWSKMEEKIRAAAGVIRYVRSDDHIYILVYAHQHFLMKQFIANESAQVRIRHRHRRRARAGLSSALPC